ncbi:MAG: hypothetical protein QM790_13805 [Nibricoccus sp.]
MSMHSPKVLACAASVLLACTATFAGNVVVPSYEQLSKTDFAELKATLEKAGWPALHVQVLLGAEIQQRLNPPEIAKASDFRPFEYWRTGPDAEPLSHLNTPERLSARKTREESARRQFEALFPETEPEEQTLLRTWDEQRKWGKLSAEKRNALSAVFAQMNSARDAFLQTRGGMLIPEEHRQLWKITEDARSELAKILSPDELLDFDLRNSSTANRMRSELDNFQPTREEFLAIFKLRLPLELNFAHKFLGQIPEVDRARADAEAATEKAIAKLLGDTRYAEYKISLEPACQTLQFDGRFARTNAVTVRQLYRALLKAQTEYKNAENLSDGERRAAQAQIKSDLFKKFRAVFDEEGTRRYLQEQNLWP